MNFKEIRKEFSKGKFDKTEVALETICSLSNIIEYKAEGNEAQFKESIVNAVNSALKLSTILEHMNIKFNDGCFGLTLQIKSDITPEDVPDLINNLTDVLGVIMGGISSDLLEKDYDSLMKRVEAIFHVLNTFSILFGKELKDFDEVD
jgi:hypothetical protein